MYQLHAIHTLAIVKSWLATFNLISKKCCCAQLTLRDNKNCFFYLRKLPLHTLEDIDLILKLPRCSFRQCCR